ncbi:MAG: sensor domain-containing phosphodiesterase [Acidimicrobiales bacterium]
MTERDDGQDVRTPRTSLIALRLLRHLESRRARVIGVTAPTDPTGNDERDRTIVLNGLVNQLVSLANERAEPQALSGIVTPLFALGYSSRDIWSLLSKISRREIDIDLTHAPPLNPEEYLAVMRVLGKLYDTMFRQEDTISTALHSGVDAIFEVGRSSTTLADLITTTLSILTAIEGILSVAFVRPDEEGIFRYEFLGGDELHRYLTNGGTLDLPPVSTSSEQISGLGPAGRAWRAGVAQYSASILEDDTMAPWSAPYTSIGIRSTMALPIMSFAGEPLALISLYSNWYGYFNHPQRNHSLIHLSRVLGETLEQLGVGSVLMYSARYHYRELIRIGAIEMVYQPIIDLKTGSAHKFEALARLRSGDGDLIAPNEFLGSLGEEELFLLFQAGVHQAMRTIEQLAPNLPQCQISLNLPPQGLTDQRYETELISAFAESRIEPWRITLELTEEEELHNLHKAAATMGSLGDLGVRFAQDDLGSGYSSLYLLAQLGFDEVKIDQTLVKVSGDHHGLNLIHHLCDLIKGLDMISTVEGLENDDLIEMVTILGADYGQGFGLARPLRRDRILAQRWERPHSVLNGPPKTVTGGLAYLRRWVLHVNVISAEHDILSNPILLEDLSGSLIDNLRHLVTERSRPRLHHVVTLLRTTGTGTTFTNEVATLHNAIAVQE